jgi:hypothetical protein
MSKPVIIVGGVLGGLVLLVGGVWGLDLYRDQQVKKYIEESIEVRLGGVKVHCESANDKLWNHQIIVNNCLINNHRDFTKISPYFAEISHLEIDAKNVKSQQFTDVNYLILRGIDLNFDIKYFPPSLNLYEMLSQGMTLSNSQQARNHQKKFFVKQMRIENVIVTVKIPNLIGSGAMQKSFQLRDIILENIHNDNYQAEISKAIQTNLNDEIQAWLGENSQTFATLILKLVGEALMAMFNDFLR